MASFEGLAEFFFSLPLYTELDLPTKKEETIVLLKAANAKVDGYCPYCGKPTTFTTANNSLLNLNDLEDLRNHFANNQGIKSISIYCARERSHVLQYWYLLNNTGVTKIGQIPSLADIANDEAAQYRPLLDKIDAHEFHKAIGLAAHGVGVGSFVYLRRIFERIIQRRFSLFAAGEGWIEDDFKRLRMNEKIDLLKDHLPDFLVQNSKIYSILSVGIHDLSEKACLDAFQFIKSSIIIILEEDRKKREELELRERATKAIAGFNAANFPIGD